MGLDFFLLGRIIYNQYFVWRTSPNPPFPTRVPKPLVRATVVSFVYLIVVLVGVLAFHGEYASSELRLFSAAWVFFALLIAITSHYVERNIRQFRAEGVDRRRRGRIRALVKKAVS
jgi:hypothetical protein